jgi:hypothetical protein
MEYLEKMHSNFFAQIIWKKRTLKFNINIQYWLSGSSKINIFSMLNNWSITSHNSSLGAITCYKQQCANMPKTMYLKSSLVPHSSSSTNTTVRLFYQLINSWFEISHYYISLINFNSLLLEQIRFENSYMKWDRSIYRSILQRQLYPRYINIVPIQITHHISLIRTI